MKGDIKSALNLIRDTPELADSIQRNVALAYAADIYQEAGIMDTAYMYAHELVVNEDILNYYCPLNFLSHDKIRAGTYCRSQP